MGQPLLVGGLAVHGKFSRGKWVISDAEPTRVINEAHKQGAYDALRAAAADSHNLAFLTRWWDLESWLERRAEKEWQ